ncbi:MAG: hypothetical protein DME98_01570 [Verrucomicrobia bacterium]|nr:MAG: hypothetical protein DME98_01570 [Verrucomicrobiota bacterium]
MEAGASPRVANPRCSEHAAVRLIDVAESWHHEIRREFINTGLQPGATTRKRGNRFNGFYSRGNPLKRLVLGGLVVTPG